MIHRNLNSSNSLLKTDIKASVFTIWKHICIQIVLNFHQRYPCVGTVAIPLLRKTDTDQSCSILVMSRINEKLAFPKNPLLRALSAKTFVSLP